MLKKIRNLGFIVDSLLIPPENVHMHIYPVIESIVRSIFKKYFQLFWKQLLQESSHHLLSAICLEQSPDLISPIKLFTPILPVFHVCPSLPDMLSVSHVLFLFRSVTSAIFFLFIKLPPNGI